MEGSVRMRLQAIADILTRHYHSECGEMDCDHTPTEVAAEIAALPAEDFGDGGVGEPTGLSDGSQC